MKFEWELIVTENNIDVLTYQETHRAKVKGGWIVRSETPRGVGLIFVPDSYHAWVIDK